MALFLMKVTFTEDVEKRLSVRPIHREFLKNLLDTGRLYAAGPFADDKGGFSIYDVADLAEAEATLAQDPFTINGVFASTEINEWIPVFSRTPVDA